MNQQKKLEEGGFLVNPIWATLICPHLIWLRKQRDLTVDKKDRIGINAGIILFSAIFLEGFLEDILCALVPHFSNGFGEKSKTLLDIERGAYKLEVYKDHFENFGFSFTKFLTNNEEEDLGEIFDFRNLLAHGQRDSYLTFHEGDWTPKKIVGSFYADIEKFFIRRKILPKSRLKQPNYSELFSDPVANWVFETTDSLEKKILKNIQSGLPLHQAMQQANLKIISNFINPG